MAKRFFIYNKNEEEEEERKGENPCFYTKVLQMLINKKKIVGRKKKSLSRGPIFFRRKIGRYTDIYILH